MNTQCCSSSTMKQRCGRVIGNCASQAELPCKSLLCIVTSRDVQRCSDKPYRLPGFVAFDVSSTLDPAHCPVRPEHAELVLVRRSRSHRVGRMGRGTFPIEWMDHVHPVRQRRHRCVFRVAVDSAPLGRHGRLVGNEIPVENTDASGILRQFEPLIGCTERLAGSLLLSYVAEVKGDSACVRVHRNFVIPAVIGIPGDNAAADVFGHCASVQRLKLASDETGKDIPENLPEHLVRADARECAQRPDSCT